MSRYKQGLLREACLAVRYRGMKIEEACRAYRLKAEEINAAINKPVTIERREDYSRDDANIVGGY